MGDTIRKFALFFTISIDNPVQREICSTDKTSFKKFLAVSIFPC